MKSFKWAVIIFSLIPISSSIGFFGTKYYLLNNTAKKTELEKKENENLFSIPCNTCVYIDKGGVNYSYKSNPILRVSVYKDEVLLNTYKTISGRWNTQLLNRNISGNESPSPNGRYIIKQESVGYHPETGGVFIGYEPTFKTQRSELGFHIDPSWGKEGKDKDGTKGCHAFKSIKEYNSFIKLINENNITELNINYE